MDSLGQDEFNPPYDVNFRLYKFSAIWKFKEKGFFASPSIFVKSSPELAHITAALTKNCEGIFDFQNCLSSTANQIRQQRLTGSCVISQQILEKSTPNLVWWLGTLTWRCANNLVSLGMASGCKNVFWPITVDFFAFIKWFLCLMISWDIPCVTHDNLW